MATSIIPFTQRTMQSEWTALPWLRHQVHIDRLVLCLIVPLIWLNSRVGCPAVSTFMLLHSLAEHHWHVSVQLAIHLKGHLPFDIACSVSRLSSSHRRPISYSSTRLLLRRSNWLPTCFPQRRVILLHIRIWSHFNDKFFYLTKMYFCKRNLTKLDLKMQNKVKIKFYY